MNKHYRSLELPKVLERLSAVCSCPDSAEKALKLTPVSIFSEVNYQISQTVTAYKLIGQFGSPSFGGIKNVNNALARANSGGSLSAYELLSVCEVLRVVRSLKEWKERHDIGETPLDNIFDILYVNKHLEDSISSAIISEEEISDNASPELANIRRKKRAASSRVRDQLEKMIRSKSTQKYLQESIITIRDGRFVVPVKAENRADIPGLVHDTSSSGSTVFIEPMAVVEANNELKILEAKEREEIDRILQALSVQVGEFSEGIKIGYSCLIELDLIFAKGKLAYDMKASEPIINEAGIIDLKKARHPLLDAKKVVPIDINIGESFDTLVITGPNTGGKTVSLKTLGLLTLMAMCGLMIPAEDNSKISVFDNILSDIGDEQSIEQSLSTFSAHMTNMIDIFKVADAYSLVLLDELGAGTDPIEGAALAISILESLRARGCKVAATTHYAELKTFALSTKGVENASCEFDVATLKPTHRLLIGLPGRSNAFAILTKLGMDGNIIDRAKELVSSENTKFEEVVEDLQQSHSKLENERQELIRLRAEAEALAKKAKIEAEAVKTEKEKILEQSKTQARQIINSARAESNRLLNELEDIKKEFSSQNSAEMLRRAKAQIKAGMGNMENIADPVEERKNTGYVLPRPLKAGDNVLLVDIDKKAVVITPPDNNGQVYVQAGIIKTRVDVSTLKLIEDKTSNTGDKRKIAPKSTYGVESRATRAFSTELDIRGHAVDEGLMELDNFLDSAVMSGIEVVTVIHGKGTGALKNAVRQHLKTHRGVKEFRRGVYGEGEDGVTVVTLK